MKLSRVLLLNLAVFQVFCALPASANPRTVDAASARTTLVTLAETGSRTASIDEVRELVESYRIDQKPALLPLATAPYPRFLINAQLKEIYPALYKSAFDDFINNIPLDLIYDGLLEMIKTDTVPESLASDVSIISPRMAKRALEGKKGCYLNLKDTGKAETTTMQKIKVVALRADFANLSSPCYYRQTIFNAAKGALLEARKKQETKDSVRKAAKDKFPVEFRKGFLKQINGTLADFPKLVGAKFGAGDTVHPIWGQNGSIVEARGSRRMKNGHMQVTLKGFAQGLLADLYAAKVLIESKDARDKSLAAGLFYSVVNRWLLLTGGVAADWDSVRKGIPVAVMGTGMTPPKFREKAFGGWGVQSEGFGVSMSAWDWNNYSPDSDENPSRYRLFPTRFEIDADGVGYMTSVGSAYQTNDDLSYMLLAVAEFLKATQPGTEFAKFFGGKDQVGDLLDAKKPMLFPTEGRMIAVGVLSAVAKNLLDPVIGHVGMKKTGLPFVFRDHASFGDISSTDIDTRGVASLLVAASKLRRVLKDDPVLVTEPKLKPVLGQVNQLVQIGALVVGRDAQNMDGSVRAKMSSDDTSVTLGSQIAAIRIFLAAFNDAENAMKASFVQARLVSALRYFFDTQVSETASLSLEARLNILAVWNQCQAEIREVRGDLPWADWESKIRTIQLD